MKKYFCYLVLFSLCLIGCNKSSDTSQASKRLPVIDVLDTSKEENSEASTKVASIEKKADDSASHTSPISEDQDTTTVKTVDEPTPNANQEVSEGQRHKSSNSSTY